MFQLLKKTAVSAPAGAAVLSTALILAAFFLTGAAMAQQADDTVSFPLDSITVTAGRTEQDLMRVPMSVSVVDDKAVDERYITTNTAEKLRDVPGASFSPNKSGPGNNSMVSLRGQTASRVLYLIDGINQNSVFKDDINKGVLTVDPTDIERIEVVRGPASSLYGSQAIGGVINIITKKGGDGRPLGGRLDFKYDGSTRGYSPHLAVFGDTENVRYRISGSLQNAGDRDSVRYGRLDHSDFKTQSVYGNIGFLWDKGEFDLSLSHYDSDVNEMAGMFDFANKVINYDPYGDPDLMELSTFPKNRRDSIVGTLVLHDPLPYMDKLTFRLHHQRRDTDQIGWQYPNTDDLSAMLRDKSKTYGAYLQGDFSFASHQVVVGLEFSHDDLANDFLTGSAYYLNPNQLYVFEAKQRNFAAFLQDVWTIADPLSLTAGLRYTNIKSEQGRLDEFPAFADRTDIFTNVVWNAGLVYEPLDVLALRVQYSQGFRAPDLASKLTGAGGYLMPNPDLGPEKSQSYEFGVRYNDNNLFVDATVFTSEVRDYQALQYLYTNPSQFNVSRTINAAKYKTTGFELAASWRIFETGLTAYGNYTHIDGKLSNQTDGTTTKNIATPKSWGSLGLKWERDVRSDMRVFADALFRAAGKYAYEDGGYVYYQNRSGKTMDLNLGFDYTGTERVMVVLSLKNLFNEEYEPAYYYYPARHVVLSASLVF